MSGGEAGSGGVSFVVPVYNMAPWLPVVLGGLKRQKGDFPREFVFVDDGSTDGSLALLQELTRDWPDTRIITQANGGSAAATNAGIQAARLPFIKFCDADDILLPHATQQLLAALVEHKAACLAWGDRIPYRSLAETQTSSHNEPVDCAITAVDAPIKAAMRNSQFNPSQFLVRTACAQSVGGCDERIVFSQDYTLTLRLAHRWPFIKLDIPVALVLDDAPERLLGNRRRQLQRVTVALAWFLHDHPDLPAELQRFACRLTAGQAWKWRSRHHGESLASPWFWRNLRSYVSLPYDPTTFIDECADAFDESGEAPPVAVAVESTTTG